MSKPEDYLIKIVRQYNKEPISQEDMAKLLAIAADYHTVKNVVYQRYGGIGGLSKLYPGYTVQNEMTDSGLRRQLQMPSVYFYLAVFDALGDIKAQWSKTRNQIQECIRKNQELTDKEKHYLRWVLSSDKVWEAILNGRDIQTVKEIWQDIDIHKLNQYIRRQTRKYLRKLHTDKRDSFSVGERAYRYGDEGIYIAVKEKRSRVYIPLTDHNKYSRQLRVLLYPAEERLELIVPVHTAIKRHSDYTHIMGIALGVHTMLTTEEGKEYGTRLGELLKEKADWLCEQHTKYTKQRNADANIIGRKKYQKQKQRIDARLHTYINEQINLFLRLEKPAVVYMPKLPPNSYGGNYKSDNFITTLWERGYIRKRIFQKCSENNIQVTEVFARNISRECSQCGANGKKSEGMFICNACGARLHEKVNTARNARLRGLCKPPRS